MSAGELARLIRMANQIATAFEGQGGQAARDTAGHIRAFWARPMREDIVRHLQAGGDGNRQDHSWQAKELAAGGQREEADDRVQPDLSANNARRDHLVE